MSRPEPALSGRSSTVLLVLTAALLLLRLGDLPLLGPDEPRYARVAVEMHRAGEWVRPTLRGEPWLEKPVLYYWLTGAAFAVLGETETAARLPSVAAAVILVGTTVLLGVRLYGRAAGLHAGFILGTSPLFFVYGRAASMDMLLAACMTAGTGLLGLRLVGVAGPMAVVGAYASIALATLAKGPIGFALPALVVGGYLAATRQWRPIGRLVSPAGILLFLLLAAPWHLLIWLDQGPAFLRVFILDHNLARLTSTIHRHPGPFYYYLPVLLAGLFPWSGLIAPAVAVARPRRSPPDAFVLSWLLLPLALFSAAGSKLPGYVLPCLPPLALLLGQGADRMVQGEPQAVRWSRVVGWIGVVFGGLLAAAPLALASLPEPGWVLLLPSGLWAVIVTGSVLARIRADPAGALSLLRVGAAGLLLLLASSVPAVLPRWQSGRHLFRGTQGREVLVWGAERAAWMSGYFYNDGRVREIRDWSDLSREAAEGSVLVLCGPSQQRTVMSARAFSSRLLARGPGASALLEVEGSTPAPRVSGVSP